MDALDLCFEMCDYIQQNGVAKLAGNTKLKDNLKKDFLHFLIGDFFYFTAKLKACVVHKLSKGSAALYRILLGGGHLFGSKYHKTPSFCSFRLKAITTALASSFVWVMLTEKSRSRLSASSFAHPLSFR